eukprot:6184839-Pleurochrysis_carterae.AAC.2
MSCGIECGNGHGSGCKKMVGHVGRTASQERERSRVTARLGCERIGPSVAPALLGSRPSPFECASLRE